MSRKAQKNFSAIDQFPVWEMDGFSKKSGLVESAFDVSIYCDGKLKVDYDFDVSEIDATGEYKIEFIPDSIGFWVVEVWVDYNLSSWVAEFDVEEWGIDQIAEMGIITKALVHDNAVLDNQIFGYSYRGQSYLTNARLRGYDSKTNAEAGGVEGLLYTFAIFAEYVDGEQTLYRLVRES